MQILIPSLNIDESLLITIKSILNTGKFKGEEIILIWDNGDAKKEIQNQIQKLGVIIHANPGNRGVASALNYGLTIASSDLIRRMDSDDLMLQVDPNLYFKEIEISNSVVCAQALTLSEMGVLRYSFIPPLPTGKISRYSFLAGNPISHPSISFSKKLISRSGGYSQMVIAEDFDLWLRLYLNGYGILNLNLPTVIYRRSAKQVSNFLDPKKVADEEFESWYQLVGHEFELDSLFLELALCRSRNCNHNEIQLSDYLKAVVKIVRRLRLIKDSEFSNLTYLNLVARLCITLVAHSNSRLNLLKRIWPLLVSSPFTFLQFGYGFMSRRVRSCFLAYDLDTSTLAHGYFPRIPTWYGK